MNRFTIELVILVFLVLGLIWLPPDPLMKGILIACIVGITLYWVIAFLISCGAALIQRIRPHEKP